jgi:hypothetical protein
MNKFSINSHISYIHKNSNKNHSDFVFEEFDKPMKEDKYSKT